MYWITGALLIWLTLPARLADIVFALDWFAPHWQCDSFGIPLSQTQRMALPFAVIALVVSALLTFAATRRRLGGTDVFDFRLKRSAREWSISFIAVALITPLAYDIVSFLSDAIFTQTWIADCAGSAEEIVVSMRRPFVQVLPVLEGIIIFWILHLQAFAISEKKTNNYP